MTLLGTGGSAGVPMIGGTDGAGDWGACDPQEPRNRRTRASILVEDCGTALLIDTSPDMRTQLLACQVARVDALLFTHAHADHVLGIDDVRALNRVVGRPLEAFATAATMAELQRRFDYAFRPWEPPHFFRPVLEQRPISAGAHFAIGALSIRSFAQDHGFVQTVGVRTGAFAYSTDVVGLDEAAFEVLAGVDTWVVGCFQREPHRTHAWVARVAEWAARVGARRTVLTHMGVDMDWAWMAQNLPPAMEAGFDGQVLAL